MERVFYANRVGRIVRLLGVVTCLSLTCFGSNGQSLDTGFVVMNEIVDPDTFVFDMRYATSDNFLETVVYPCANCMLRPEVAYALIGVNNYLRQIGFKLKIFDCYRPLHVQHAMWKKFPKPGYVANPNRGSVHNRGGAVDLTIVRLDGEYVAMGTDFDYFGPRANHTFTDLDSAIISNRRFLKRTMEKFGFEAIRTEWWHYNYASAYEYELSDQAFDCQ